MRGGASQSFLDDVALFCNLIGCGEILLRGTKIEYVFHQTLFPCAIKRLGMRLGLAGQRLHKRESGWPMRLRYINAMIAYFNYPTRMRKGVK